jgi:tetratricopeptide (TPR) repeat protein
MAITNLRNVYGKENSAVIDSLIMGLPLKEQIRTLHEYTTEMRQSNMEMARLASNKALGLSELAGDDRLHARSLLNAGSLYLRTSIADSAEIMYETAAALFYAAKDSAGIADLKMNQGVLQLNLSEYRKALTLFREGLEYAAPRNDTLQILKLQQNSAITHHYMGDFVPAKEYYLEILNGNYGNKYPEILLNTMSNLGSLLEQFDEYSTALSYYNMALRLADSLENPYRKAIILTNIANVYMQINRSNEALEALISAYYINETLGNKQQLASTLSQMGVVYEIEGNPQRANELYLQSLELSEQIGDHRRVAITMAYIGENLMNQGFYTNALSYYRKSLQMFTRLELQAETTEVYKWLTFVHVMNGSLDSADVYIEKYAELTKNIEHISDFSNIPAINTDSAFHEKPDEKVSMTENQLFWSIFSIVIVSGLIVYIFLLMAFITSSRQRRKKIYRKSRRL